MLLILCRPIISQYGLWDQLRVDHGREWYLILAVQQKLATLRVNQSRPSYLQTTSTMVCGYVMQNLDLLQCICKLYAVIYDMF